MVKESLNRLAQPRRMFSSDECLTKPYVSMAEAVKKLQQNTPERFRTKPKLEVFQSKLERTIPHSPHLICSTRNRPVNFLFREEQEKRDFEEAQKFKIKAQPLNKKILKGPLKPTVLIERKPNTVPEPFRLTEVHSKVVQPPKTEISKFRGQPIPDFNKEVITKSIYQKRVTNPQTPNVLKKYQKTIQQKPQSYSPQEVQKQRTKLTNTLPLPFSFQARDDAMRKRREEFLRKVYAEEKRAREFHTRPIPKAVLLPSKSRNASLNSAPVKQHSIKPRIKSEENLSTEFKAKPATVLYKKPFEPKKEERPLTEISEFVLNTDHRAKEREHFELLLKEKEERVALLKQLDEQMRFEQEQEEIMRLRKMTEYRAQPIKKYKEFTIQPSGKITEPISPTFHYKKMTNKGLNSENKENSK